VLRALTQAQDLAINANRHRLDAYEARRRVELHDDTLSNTAENGRPITTACRALRA